MCYNAVVFYAQKWISHGTFPKSGLLSDPALSRLSPLSSMYYASESITTQNETINNASLIFGDAYSQYSYKLRAIPRMSNEEHQSAFKNLEALQRSIHETLFSHGHTLDIHLETAEKLLSRKMRFDEVVNKNWIVSKSDYLKNLPILLGLAKALYARMSYCHHRASNSSWIHHEVEWHSRGTGFQKLLGIVLFQFAFKYSVFKERLDHLMQEKARLDAVIRSGTHVTKLKIPAALECSGAYMWSLKDIKIDLRHINRILNQIVEANLLLVMKAANEFKQFAAKAELNDLIQEGNLALHHAALTFDPTRGFTFATYATRVIKTALGTYIKKNNFPVVLPAKKQKLLQVIRSKCAECCENSKLPLSVPEIVIRTGIPLKSVIELIPFLNQSISLDTVYEDGPGMDCNMFLACSDRTPRDNAIRTSNREALQKVLKVLKPLELEVIESRYNLDARGERTLQQLASKFNLTKERIRQIEFAALSRLRDANMLF